MKKYLFLGFFLLAALFVLPISAKAESGIQISPVTFNFDFFPGQTKTATLTITNRSNQPLDYVMETENFDKSTEEGVPNFSVSRLGQGITGVAQWVTFPDGSSGTIAPLKSKEVPFTVNVPQNANPGGNYGAVFAREVKKNTEGQNTVSIANRVGALVLGAVAGDVTNGIQISEFTAPKIIWKGPVNLDMRVQNTGTVHYDSKATISFRSILGNTSEVDLGTHTILPNNIRSYEGIWSKKYPFGPYTVTATALNGSNQLATTTVTMWAIPLTLVIPVIIGLIILIIIFVYFKRHFRFVSSKKE